MCEVKLSDIEKVFVYNARVIIKIIARVTKANQDWITKEVSFKNK